MTHTHFRPCSFFLMVMLALSALPVWSQKSPEEQALDKILSAHRAGETFLGLHGLYLSKLPPEIGLLTNLRLLDLEDNLLQSLPPEIGNLKKLEILYLANNELESLPPQIGNLSQLHTLGLSGNRLAQLPASIGKLRRLEILNLQSNNFTVLPTQLNKLPKLKYLFLGGNSIEELSPALQQKTAAGRLRALLRLPDWDAPENEELMNKFGFAPQIMEVPDEDFTDMSMPDDELIISMPKPEAEEIFRVVENMPSYPGCEHITDEASKDACTQRKVLEYLKTNMSYRPAVFEKNVDYVAVIQFLVSNTGLVYDMKVTKAPDEESRAALLKSLQSMASRMLFTPGTQRGRPITFTYRMQVDLKKLAGK